MRRLLALTALAVTLTACASSPAPAPAEVRAGPAAPTPDEFAVRAVVNRLFDGMRARDTTMMASVFHDEARFYGLGRNGGVQVTLPSAFMRSIAGAPAGMVLDEVLHTFEVNIDGPLASAWMYYDFFAGDDFSHCGHNTMQLLKVSGEWKIVALADTRRQEGCRRERAS